MSQTQNDTRPLAQNRRAFHEYHVLERLEAGIVLTGPEVKSCRAGRVQLRDGYVDFRNGEAWLVGVHVSEYVHARRDSPAPVHDRKLLLSKREIERWAGKVQEKGRTVVPLSMYAKGDRLKVEIALVQGKKLYDKREAERRKELDREAARAMAGERE